ncbi:hypothetical protein G9A89_020092 [Geosiphon pyriformis]|nr:hypothetical protein G9A89_020092 [Geosiphon pyriformis]
MNMSEPENITVTKVRRNANFETVKAEHGESSSVIFGSGNLLGENEQQGVIGSENQLMKENIAHEEHQNRIEKVIALARDEDTLGRLISPCLCKGTMRYVHVECLNNWRLRSQKKTSFFQCDECKYQYAFRRTTIAKYATNGFVLTIVTLILFAFCVFVGGFFSKLFLYLNDYPASFSEILSEESEETAETALREPMTFATIFTIDHYHLASGFVFVGIVGFLQILFSLIWLGPFPSWNIRLPSGSGGGGGGRGDSFAALVIAVILVVGIVKAIWGMYKLVQGVSRLILERVELVILEVNASSHQTSQRQEI